MRVVVKMDTTRHISLAAKYCQTIVYIHNVNKTVPYISRGMSLQLQQTSFFNHTIGWQAGGLDVSNSYGSMLPHVRVALPSTSKMSEGHVSSFRATS